MTTRRYASRALFARVCLSSVAFCVSPVAASTPLQESVRNLAEAEQAAKYLTPGEVDSWIFEGKKDETVIVHVSTSEFDPVIGLAAADGDVDRVLFSVDDEGSVSQFSHRLSENGTYKIRVHGFEMKGGGNYALSVQRFVGNPIELGERVSGRFDRNGQANFFFESKRDANLVVVASGSQSEGVYGPKGNSLRYNWHTTILIEQDGEHLINLQGRRGRSFKLLIRPVEPASLTLGESQEIETAGNDLNVWEIEAEPGDFRFITATRASDLDSRLIYAPREIKRGKLLDEDREFAPITLLPVSSKGDVTRYAAVFGRKGRYQLQTFLQAKSKITVSMSDPTIELRRGESPANQLPIGGAHFYGFHARAGDLITSNLDSNQFDACLRLFDERGQLVTENDDSRETVNSEVTLMVTRNGFYRWQVASLGNGGGGEYQLAFREIELRELAVGGRARGQLTSGTTEFWSLDGEKGQNVFINVKSSDFDPRIEIYGPDGHRHAADDNSGVGAGSLIALEFPTTGRFTIWVSSQRNAGDYDIRVIDADWGDGS